MTAPPPIATTPGQVAPNLKTWARRYGDMGWAVFPVQPRGKIPMTSHGVLDATSDDSQIKNWWMEWPDANIGLACGEASRLWVLDVDNRTPEGGVSGHQALENMQIEHGPLPFTLESVTGGGGRHLFFNLPVGVKVKNKVNARTGSGNRQGLDVRGTGGYVVLPPSVHDSGNAYSWSQRRAISDAPDWLYAVLGDPTRQETPPWCPPVIPADADKVQRYVRRALINAALRIAHTGAGGRHQAIVEEASSIGRYAAAGLISDTEVLECLVGAALTAGKGEAEARRTVAQQLEWARAYPKVPVLT